VVVRLPGVEHLIIAVAHRALQDHALARLCDVNSEEFISKKFKPTLAGLDCVAPFLLVIASRGARLLP